MTVIEIARFGPEPPHTPDSTTCLKAAEALRGTIPAPDFVLSTRVQKKDVVQITSEWDGDRDYTNFTNAPKSAAFAGSLRDLFGDLKEVCHVDFDQSPVRPRGPSTAAVVEHVKNTFAVSRLTPEFQRQIEADFLRFDEIYQKGAPEGQQGLAMGWTLEEVDHADIKGEKTRSFVIIRGWSKIDDFERSLQTDFFKEGAKILYAWNAPYEMWHVESKIEVHSPSSS